MLSKKEYLQNSEHFKCLCLYPNPVLSSYSIDSLISNISIIIPIATVRALHTSYHLAPNTLYPLFQSI